MTRYFELWRAAAEAFNNYGAWLFGWTAVLLVSSFIFIAVQCVSCWKIRLHATVVALILCLAWVISARIIIDVVWNIDELMFRAALHHMDAAELFKQRRWAVVACAQMSVLNIALNCLLTALLILSARVRPRKESGLDSDCRVERHPENHSGRPLDQ